MMDSKTSLPDIDAVHRYQLWRCKEPHMGLVELDEGQRMLEQDNYENSVVPEITTSRGIQILSVRVCRRVRDQTAQTSEGCHR